MGKRLKMANNRTLEKCGELRQETSADGRPYFNLKLRGEPFVLFANGFKSEYSHPDFIVYERVKEKKAMAKKKAIKRA